MEKKIKKVELKKKLYFRYTENSNTVQVVISKSITQKDIDIMKDDPKYVNKIIQFDMSKEVMKETLLPITKKNNPTSFGSIIQFDISEDMIQEWFNKLDNI
jgi:hypothetical protein